MSNACHIGLVCSTQQTCAEYVGEGASCTTATTECGGGLFCDGGICVGVPDLGGACAASRQCLRGYCSSADSVCYARKGGGAACASYDECASYRCTDGIYEPPICP
jgi:hypothetical protein